MPGRKKSQSSCEDRGVSWWRGMGGVATWAADAVCVVFKAVGSVTPITGAVVPLIGAVALAT